MKHRIRTAPSCDGNPKVYPHNVLVFEKEHYKDHTFLEVRPDEWLEVSLSPDELGAENVADFCRRIQEHEKPNADGVKKIYLKYPTRYFAFIENWQEAGVIETGL